MSIAGRLAWSLRSRFSHGLRVAYYRDVVRRQVLRTCPVDTAQGGAAEIHALTSGQDWLNLIWTLKSFYYFSNKRYALCIHEDGSLPHDAFPILERHFPGARIIRRTQADREVLAALAAYPRCYELRRTNTLSLKVFDFRHYLQAERMVLLDSDILFFREPAELLRRIEDPNYRLNTVNADVADAYTVDPATVKHCCGFELQPLFNSGLGLIHKPSLNLDWIEEFLGLPGIRGHFWRIEQTLFALCSSRFGVELLPESYRVHLNGHVPSAPCRHYVGAIRHLFYGEGIASLAKRGFLTALMAGSSPCAS